MPPFNYNINPSPQFGNGAFGLVPGPIGIPPNRYEGIQSIYPNLSRLTGGAGDVIQHEIAGELSPETINSIQDEAARFGIKSGMPLSGFAGNRGLRNLGINVDQRQRQGVQDYNSMLGSLAPLTTDPNLAAEIAARNATMNAAPNPEAAARAQMDAYMRALEAAAARARGPGGGNGNMPGGPQSGTMPGNNQSPFAPPTMIGPGSPPQSYRIPGDTSMVWSGQDWTDLFGNPYESAPDESNWNVDWTGQDWTDLFGNPYEDTTGIENSDYYGFTPDELAQLEEGW